MTDTLIELRKAVDAFLGHPHYYGHAKAHSLAHHKLHKEMFMKVPDDAVNWPVLHAIVDHAPLVLRVGSAHLHYSQRDRIGHQKFVPDEGGQFMVCLARDGKDGRHRYAIEPRGNWSLSSGSEELTGGEYDLSTVPLTPAKKQKKRGGKHHKAYAVVRLPVVGMLGQRRAASADMPVCEIRLKVKVRSDSSGGTRSVSLKGAELVCHERTRANMLFAPQAAPYAVTGKGFLATGSSFMPFTASASSSGFSPQSAKMSGNSLMAKYAPADGAAGLYFVRRGEVFFGQEADGGSAFALGTASQAFVNVAVLKNALAEHLDSPTAALADPALVDSKLRSAGHAAVADALQELYIKRYGYSNGPSFAQLLTHTSGLPAYPQLSGNEFVELTLMSAGVKSAHANEPAGADDMFALRLRNSTLLCGAPGAGYVESPLGYALLLLTLPSPAEEFIAQVLGALGGVSGRFSTGLERGAPQFSGVYSLYDGVQMPLSGVAKMLSADAFHRMDKLAGVSVQQPVQRITNDASVTLGGWCARDIQLRDGDSPQRVLYHVGISRQSCVVLVFLPKYSTAAVFGVSPMQRDRMMDARNKSCYATIVDVARALEDASGAATSPRSASAVYAPPMLPAETPEAAEAMRSSALALRGDVAANASASLTKFFGADRLKSLTTDVTMQFSAAETAPGDLKRQLVTLTSANYGMSNTFIVVFDPSYTRYATGTGSSATPAIKGAYRVVHPLTQKLGEPLLLQVLTRGADTMPLLSYRNMIFARTEDAQRLTAMLDNKSAEHHAMLVQRAAADEEQQQKQSQMAALTDATVSEKRKKLREAQKTGDESSDDEQQIMDVDARIGGVVAAKTTVGQSNTEPTGVLHLLEIGRWRRGGGGGGGWVGPFVAGGLLGGLAASSLYPYYGYSRPYYPYAYAPPYGYPYYYGYPRPPYYY